MGTDKGRLPTAKEVFELARKAGYDSFGICCDPEPQDALDKLTKTEGGPEGPPSIVTPDPTEPRQGQADPT